MSRGSQTFKQVDLTKALKGAANAGIKVRRIEIDKKTGNIVLYAGQADDPQAPKNEWDDVR
ncbi:hypothetical protein [Bradyrhizobium erythrophlei]|uniref:Uncharacterized protein n=1 Tax=Bradyrhizobium erythrophlei TaxID=1437360 RepID=A0A1M5R9V9_9BRAD|nr:hypothetical protein [Bradyrhizobium erythrophlei]SHH23031.1 hypothetical protein SAMN05444169_6435 [Bradyrhizobium erythrophlei]